jgi:hypothetical protein
MLSVQLPRWEVKNKVRNVPESLTTTSELSRTGTLPVNSPCGGPSEKLAHVGLIGVEVKGLLPESDRAGLVLALSEE